MEYLLTLVNKIMTCQKQMRKLNLSELVDDTACSYGHKLEIQTGHYKNISTGRAVQHWKRLSGKAGESQSLDAYRTWPKSQLTYQSALVSLMLPERGWSQWPSQASFNQCFCDSVLASDLQAVLQQSQQCCFEHDTFIASCSLVQTRQSSSSDLDLCYCNCDISGSTSTALCVDVRTAEVPCIGLQWNPPAR